MNAKFILYIIITPLTIWALLGLNIEKYFKKNKINEIKVTVFLLTLAISYLVVNFLYDFLEVTKLY